MRLNLYAQGRHTLIIAGVPISGFGEGDWIEIKIDGNAAERSKGGDGPAMNISVPQGGKITVGLLPTSPALGTMYEIRALQASNPILFPISLMTGTEEVITASGCAFGDLPQFATGAEKMQTRKFDFEALQITPDFASVESILGSVAGGLV
jgi:hypothetical protein